MGLIVRKLYYTMMTACTKYITTASEARAWVPPAKRAQPMMWSTGSDANHQRFLIWLLRPLLQFRC